MSSTREHRVSRRASSRLKAARLQDLKSVILQIRNREDL